MSPLRGYDVARLRWVLGVLFVALVLPGAVLVDQALGQLRYESVHRHRLQAEELSARIDARLSALIAAEEERTFTDYRFLVVTGDPAARFVERSPLARFPVATDFPGLIGYFQVDASGSVSTPLLPGDVDSASAYGVTGSDYAGRLALQTRIQSLLSQPQRDAANEAAPAARAADPTARAEDFDRLVDAAAPAYGLGKVSELDLAPAYRAERLEAPASQSGEESALVEATAVREPLGPATTALAPNADDARRGRADGRSLTAGPRDRVKRIEQNVDLERLRTAAATAGAASVTDLATAARVTMFESELDPFAFSVLDDAHFVLHRNVWRDRQRLVQGAIVERSAFLEDVVERAFDATALAGVANLVVGYDDDVVRVLGLADPSTLLYRGRMAAPLGGLELIFGVDALPLGPGAAVIAWVAGAFGFVLCAGFLVLYRLGVGQIELNRQQQDFVAAVSHELKTPLTSIRMYGEMLKSGWVDEDKKRGYYQFIFDESERLSRLINDVLALARLTRNRPALETAELPLGELLELTRTRIAAQVEQAGFELATRFAPEAVARHVVVDRDAFAQVVINLVDNALKFAADSAPRRIELGAALGSDGRVTISVRDYGPGVPRDRLKKIFRLFYRAESELTRATVGTGIGLALVRELTTAMGGSVDVVNREPGAEFRLSLPSASAEPSE